MFKWVLRLPKYSWNIPSTWCQRIGGLLFMLQWITLRSLKVNSPFLPYKLLEICRNLLASLLSRNNYTLAPWAAHWVLWLTHNLYPHLNCLQYILEVYQPPLRPVHHLQTSIHSHLLHPHSQILIWRTPEYRPLRTTPPTHSAGRLLCRSVLFMAIPQRQVLNRLAISSQWHVHQMNNLHLSWAH